MDQPASRTARPRAGVPRSWICHTLASSALALLVLALSATPALATLAVSGEINRFPPPDQRVHVELHNNSTMAETIDFLRLEFPSGESASNIVCGGLAGFSCSPDVQPNKIHGSFIAPWAAGQDISVLADVSPILGGNAGANLFVCPTPCGIYQGPFALMGPPALATAPCPAVLVTTPYTSVWPLLLDQNVSAW